MYPLFIVLLYFLIPFFLLWLCYKYTFLNKVGAVLLAYIAGIVIFSSGFLKGEQIETIQDTIMSICIPIGIPLLLYSSDFKKSFLLARKTLFSLIAALISVVIVVATGYVIFNNGDESFYKISALLCGVYTGGTPNLAALKMALNVDPSSYISVHTYDMFFSTIHLFFLITVGKKFYELILPSFQRTNSFGFREYMEDKELFGGILKRQNVKPLLMALGITVIIVAVGGGLMQLVVEKSKMAVFILSITTLAIIASFNKKVNAIPKTFNLGMYFILVFSVVVASKLKLSQLMQINSTLFYYVGFAVFGSTILHIILSRIFKVDADTVMVTSVSLICSPPFVPVVAGAIKNREVIIPGITVGVIGYAIGNYLGYIMSEFLQMI
ncbi:DUF819 family protein [Plebeiibacterium sediminum]|uniref:DUF819 family protein n=1 Tax=Plebeiibacterium sediminum TaxID=2992112 RepID=A0AAE3M4H8_9BACT|nr:DUF819 family protein [Plebeiobacterium sediminum]MCW3787072.1 DUF819 family protein [Plebeiobacterium sediminum]